MKISPKIIEELKYISDIIGHDNIFKTDPNDYYGELTFLYVGSWGLLRSNKKVEDFLSKNVEKNEYLGASKLLSQISNKERCLSSKCGAYQYQHRYYSDKYRYQNNIIQARNTGTINKQQYDDYFIYDVWLCVGPMSIPSPDSKYIETCKKIKTRPSKTPFGSGVGCIKKYVEFVKQYEGIFWSYETPVDLSNQVIIKNL